MHERMSQHMRERAMERFSEWRDRHHWRDRDGDYRTRRDRQGSNGTSDNGDDDSDEGEQL
jgi:hypothetical protein